MDIFHKILLKDTCIFYLVMPH